MKEYRHNISVAEIVLRTIGAMGLIGVAMVAPNALKLFKILKQKKYNQTYYINSTIRKLIDKKWLKEVVHNNKRSIVLTEKGKLALLRYQTKDRVIVKNWDKKWRIVMFDIWESNRGKRDAFRKEIKQIGFVQLQQSVWIYPFDCRDYFQLIVSELRFGKNVRYMEVSSLDDDTSLRRRFNLPLP